MRLSSWVRTTLQHGDAGPGARQGPGQLDLFQDRYVSLQRARDLLARGQLDGARDCYAEMCARYPEDTTIAHEAAALNALLARMARVPAAPLDDRVAALAGMADELAGAVGIRAGLRVFLLELVAHEIEAARGPEAALCGRVPGHYYLQAGSVARARASLERALARSRAAPVLFAWADLLVECGQTARARAVYLEALVRDPFASALDRARDPEIAALPDLARNEFDIAGEPRAWCAPVGIVLRVLPNLPGERLRAILRQSAGSTPDRGGDGEDDQIRQIRACTPSRARALGCARQFVLALQDAAICRGDELIAARRTLKRLQPALFRAYMGRHEP